MCFFISKNCIHAKWNKCESSLRYTNNCKEQMEQTIKRRMQKYVRLNRLAVGKVSKTKKEYYKALLEKSLAVLNGEEDEENIIYGDGWVKDFFDRKQALLERLKAVTEHNLPDDTSEKVEEKASSFDENVKAEALSGNADMLLPFEGLDRSSTSGEDD